MFHRTSLALLFYKKKLNCFNDFQNQIQTIEMKQNQIFFQGTYSNLMSYVIYLKNIKAFQRLSESKFLNFMTKVN